MPSRMEPDWRDPAGYRPLLALDRPGFAWEFLRRNPAYRAEAPRTPPLQRQGRTNLLRIDAPAGGAARWGLWFPGGARARCFARPHALARRA